MRQKIFLVEDDPTIAQLTSNYLTEWGYVCQTVHNFQDVTAEIEQFQADLVLLDIGLPFYNGFYWCQAIREKSEVPIIFLSSASDNVNMVMAMNMGADDFIAKPFDLSVLVAKIQALLRRSYQFTGPNTTQQYGPYQLNVAENSLVLGREQLPLTQNESKILSILFQSVGRVVTREQLMEALWESEAFIDHNTLAVNMTRLRKKITPIGLAKRVQTIKNKGFLLEVYNESP